MGVLAVVAVGGCGAWRSERTRVLGAPAAPSDPSFLLSGVESAGAEVPACPAASGVVPASARSPPKCGAIGAVLSNPKVLKGREGGRGSSKAGVTGCHTVV